MAAEPAVTPPGDAGSSPHGAPGAPLRVVDAGAALPAQVRSQVDELFTDADQHGPRAMAILLRTLPALVALPLGLAAAARPDVRRAVFEAFGADASSTVLVAPVLVLVVLLGGALAPLVRTSAVRLVAAGAMLLGVSAWVVHGGDLVAAAVPGALGGLLLGLGAARAVRRAVWVLPVLLAAGASDARSVQGGLTHDLLEDVGDGSVAGPLLEVARLPLTVPAGEVHGLDYVVLHLPAAGSLWVFGLVDVVAIGLLLGLTHLYWRPVAFTVAAFAAVAVATTVSGSPLPVLPFLGLAWVVVNASLVWRSTRFTLRRLLYLGG